MALSTSMTTGKWDVVLVGDLFFDHVMSGFDSWPEHGSEVFASDYQLEIGGGAAITACSLARLGRRVSVLGTIGRENSGWIKNRLSSFGVSIEALHSCDRSTGVTVSISNKHDRTFFTHLGANSALPAYLQTSHALDVLEKARHAHFAMPVSADLAAVLFSHLHSADCSVSIDVGWQAEWLRDEQSTEILRQTDFFLPNEREMRFFSRHDSPTESLRHCAQLGIPCTVLKLGARGAAMLVGETLEAALPPRVDAVDTTGAGDAFNAGFIDAYLDDLAPLEMLKRGCICGALSTRSLGALSSLPDRGELSSFV